MGQRALSWTYYAKDLRTGLVHHAVRTGFATPDGTVLMACDRHFPSKEVTTLYDDPVVTCLGCAAAE